MQSDIFDRLKKEAREGKKEAIQILAEYVGTNQSIAKKYGKSSDYCKKKWSDFGQGSTAAETKSKICQVSSLAELKIPLINKKIKKRLEDLLEEIETKLKIEHKTPRDEPTTTTTDDKKRLAALTSMLT